MTFAPIPPPPAPPAPPADKRPRRFSRTQRAVIAGGLAAGLALGGAGISFAASSGSSSTTTPPTTNAPSAPVKPGHGPRGFGKGLFGLGGFGRAVRGQVTVRTSSGFQTINFQLGTADVAGSSAGISVTSADKHQQSYTVNSSTTVNGQLNGINSVKKGDEVEVIANSSYTAIRIVDLTGLKNSWAGFGFGPAGNPGDPAGQPRTAEAGAF